MTTKILTEEKAETLIAKYVPVAKSEIAKNPIHAIALSNKIKFPLVLKLISPKALHKTEINGVRIVGNIEDLRKEFVSLYKTAMKKRIKPFSILVQEFIRGEEVIIGIKHDGTFGHIIAFGIGGKFVELVKDVSFRACPITEKDAQSMIDELKFGKVLYGVRGKKAVNIKLLKKTLIAVSHLPEKIKGIEELDINPFIISSKIGKVTDARIVLK